MKNPVLNTLFVVATLSASAAFAQQKMDDMKGMDMPAKAASGAQTIHHATGVIRKIDAQAGVVTFAHEAVPSLKWPPMTMGFQVQDRMMLNKFAVGQKVDFDFVQRAKGYVVTGLR